MSRKLLIIPALLAVAALLIFWPRERRTAVDFAQEVAWLLEEVYPDAPTVVLVCDNLNTQTEASLYQAFEPQRARALAAKLDIRHTPKHGNWLNTAECELSAMTRQALCGRIATLQRQVGAWEQERNRRQTGVNWQFTTADARIKLKSLYPQPQLS